MANGRTLQKHFRFYVDGYDLSGMTRSVGPFGIVSDEADLTTWTDQVKGYLPGHTQITLGTFNAVFDNTAATGVHTVLGTAGGLRTCLLAMGIRGAPADGDPCFAGQFKQGAYQAVDDGITWQAFDVNAYRVTDVIGFDGRLYATGLDWNGSDYQYELYRSDDDGQTWQTLPVSIRYRPKAGGLEWRVVCGWL